MVSESEARLQEYIEGRRVSQEAIIKEIREEKDKEIEQYKHTLEHDTKEIKLLMAEIDQKDEEIERLREIIKCKDVLLIAYRLGTRRGVEKALDRLEILGESE